MAGKKRGWKGNEAGGCFMVLNCHDYIYNEKQ